MWPDVLSSTIDAGAPGAADGEAAGLLGAGVAGELGLGVATTAGEEGLAPPPAGAAPGRETRATKAIANASHAPRLYVK